MRILDAKDSLKEIVSTSQILCTISESKHTFRGMHLSNDGNRKIVTCIAGMAFDVVVDLRIGSPYFGRQQSLILSPGEQISIPSGFAHGYVTLEDNTALLYCLQSSIASQNDDRYVHYSSKVFDGIEWPQSPSDCIMSDNDRAATAFEKLAT